MSMQRENAALLRKIAEMEAQIEALKAAKRNTPSFNVAPKNAEYFIFANGLMEKGIHPLTTAHRKAWWLILDHAQEIADKTGYSSR